MTAQKELPKDGSSFFKSVCLLINKQNWRRKEESWFVKRMTILKVKTPPNLRKFILLS